MITIYLDNIIAIKNLTFFSSYKLIQNKNWDILQIINSLKENKNISLKLIKVKSHSNISLHNQADLLAKQGTTKPIIKFSPLLFNYPIYFN